MENRENEELANQGEDVAGRGGVEFSNLKLKDILNVEEIQSLMDDFFSITSIGSAIVDIEGNVIVSTGWQDICIKFHRENKLTLANCIDSDTQLSKGVEPGAFKTYRCKNNMLDLVTPIYISGKHFGNIFLGQFFYEGENIDYDYFRNAAKKYGFDEKKYIEALDKVPKWSEERAKTVLSFYSKLAQILSKLSYSAIEQANTNIEKDKILEQLREREEKWKLMLKASPDGIVITDLEGNIVDLSDTAFKMYGYENKNEVLGMNITGFVDIEDRERAAKNLSNMLRGAFQGSEEYCVVNKSGEKFYIDANAEIIKDKDGNPMNIFLIERDVTERKYAREYILESEQKFKSITQSAIDAIIMIDESGKVIYWSPSADRMFGYQYSEVIGKDVHDYIMPKHYEKEMKKGIEKFKRTGTGNAIGKVVEMTALKKNGNEFPIELALTSISKNGKYRATAIIRDISERKNYEESLRETSDYLNKLFNYANAPIITWDRNFRITRFNGAFEHLSGYSLAEVLGSELKILFPDDTVNESMGNIIRTSSGEFWDSVEIPIKKKSGEIRIALWNSANIYSNDKKTIIATIAQGQDITERIEAEKKLIVAKEKAEEMNKIKSSFLANMSHELRTPMVGILGFAEILSSTIEGPENKKMAEQILNAGTRLTNTLNMILDLSRIEANKTEMKPVISDLTEITARVSNLYIMAAEKKGLKLNTELTEEIYTKLDTGMTEKVIDNLIQNAIVYTKEGSVTVTTGYEIIDNKRYSFLKVKDTGIGIPENMQELIYDPFRQVSEGWDRNYEGTGLGLTITKKYVEMMGGQIILKSKEGSGSEFKVIFPC